MHRHIRSPFRCSKKVDITILKICLELRSVSAKGWGAVCKKVASLADSRKIRDLLVILLYQLRCDRRTLYKSKRMPAIFHYEEINKLTLIIGVRKL